MLMLSKRVEYGLMALLHVDATSSASVVSSKEIAEEHGLPVDLMGKVMQAMARGGLLEAEHGARGGYRLKRDLAAISLGDVIDAIEGPPRLVRCQQDVDGCLQFSSCQVKEPLQDIHARLHDFLHGIALDEFRRERRIAAAEGS